MNLWPVPVCVDPEDPTPLHVQLAGQIADAVREGRLAAGAPLPSVRRAAVSLKISPGTVTAAYRSLISRGLAVSRPGSGYSVPERVVVVPVDDVPDLADELYTLEDIEWMGGRRQDAGTGVFNLASATPDADPLTVRDVRDAFSQVLTHSLEDALDYQEPLGYAPLRGWLVEELARGGVSADPDCVQIISGAQQGLDIVAKALLQPGDTVLVEYPTYPGAVAVFRSRGARVVGIPVDSGGMDPDRLMAAMRQYRPRLLYLIPFYQNPTGVVYSRERLQAILRIADAFGSLIVEDDYLRELRYDGGIAPPMKQMDEAGRIILVKSYSKLLMPGLRIAYMAVPQARAARLALAKHTTDIFTSGLLQQGFHRFCAAGGWESHLARMRSRLGGRCRLLGQTLRAELGSMMAIPEPTGGLSYWIPLPEWADPEALYRLAGARGVRIVPDTLFWDEGVENVVRDGPGRVRHVRLSFAASGQRDIVAGVGVLAEILSQQQRGRWKRVGWRA